MLGRTLLVGGLLFGTISAQPLMAAEANTPAPIARDVSVDDRIDTLAIRAKEWWHADIEEQKRDVDADNVIDTVAGWSKDWWHTDATATDASVHKRDLDTDNVVDTVSGWTKEWLHSAPAPAHRVRDVEQRESVDETIDRFSTKLKDHLNSGKSLNTRDLNLNWDSIFGTVLGWLEEVNWTSLIRTVMGLLQNVNWTSIIDTILRWTGSLFGISSGGGHSRRDVAIALRSSGIDWSSIVQDALLWATEHL